MDNLSPSMKVSFGNPIDVSNANLHTGGPFYLHDLALIPAWISNYIHYKVWYEITYPFLNFTRWPHGKTLSGFCRWLLCMIFWSEPISFLFLLFCQRPTLPQIIVSSCLDRICQSQWFLPVVDVGMVGNDISLPSLVSEYMGKRGLMIKEGYRLTWAFDHQDPSHIYNVRCVSSHW